MKKAEAETLLELLKMADKDTRQEALSILTEMLEQRGILEGIREKEEELRVLRSAAETAVVRVFIDKGAGSKLAREELMHDIADVIQKKNRQLARTGERRMAFRIELV